jgi:hypothetical protein
MISPSPAALNVPGRCYGVLLRPRYSVLGCPRAATGRSKAYGPSGRRLEIPSLSASFRPCGERKSCHSGCIQGAWNSVGNAAAQHEAIKAA